MTLIRHTRHTTAAALLAACVAASCVPPAFAAGDDGGPDAAGPADPRGALAGAAPAEEPGRTHGPGPRGARGPDGGDGPGFGGPRPGAPGLETPSHRRGPPPHAGFGLFGRLRHLDLSEAQQDKLFTITHAAAPQQRDQEKAERKAREALRALGGSARFDEARANAAARDLGQAIANGALLRARLESQVLALLTPEQREQVRQAFPPGPQEGPERP